MRYGGSVRSITPATTDDNWFLTAGANEVGAIFALEFTGEATTGIAMATRVARSSGQAGAATAGNVAKLTPNAGTNLLTFGTTFATTQPTLDAGDLFAASWNANGGIVRWAATMPDEEFILIGAVTETVISCRNAVGVGISTYTVRWREF
jgi:hypothetical protein